MICDSFWWRCLHELQIRKCFSGSFWGLWSSYTSWHLTLRTCSYFSHIVSLKPELQRTGATRRPRDVEPPPIRTGEAKSLFYLNLLTLSPGCDQASAQHCFRASVLAYFTLPQPTSCMCYKRKDTLQLIYIEYQHLLLLLTLSAITLQISQLLTAVQHVINSWTRIIKMKVTTNQWDANLHRTNQLVGGLNHWQQTLLWTISSSLTRWNTECTNTGWNTSNIWYKWA